MKTSPTGQPYSPDPDDYIPTCPSCAMHYDKGNFELFGVLVKGMNWNKKRRIQAELLEMTARQ